MEAEQVNRVVHERFFLPGISRALGIFLLRAHRPPAVLWPRAANKTKEKRQQIASVSRAQPSATIKNAFHRHWSHDPLELGSDGDADLAQRRPDSAKLFYSSYSRLFPRVGYQPAVRVAAVGSKAMAMQHPRRCYVADRRGAWGSGGYRDITTITITNMQAAISAAWNINSLRCSMFTVLLA